MNFIVIAVMVVLVLIVVTLMFLRGTDAPAIDIQGAINTCESKCVLESSIARGVTGTYENTNSEYCKLKLSIKGMGNEVNCTQIAPCTIDKVDGSSCKITCSGNTATC